MLFSSGGTCPDSPGRAPRTRDTVDTEWRGAGQVRVSAEAGEQVPRLQAELDYWGEAGAEGKRS